MDAPDKRKTQPKTIFSNKTGRLVLGRCEEVLNSDRYKKYHGKVQLIFTSPPFPLNRKKAYGNLTGQQYLRWLESLAPLLKKFLAPNGSIVMEIGNAWEAGEPIQSTLPMESLLAFQKAGDLKLCQEFTYYNPARLPSPAQWVNVERIRVKDSTTRLWWMSPISTPKASNRNVLREYSRAQLDLMKRGSYNSGKRPSQFNINKTAFLKNNGGAIPSNLIEISNTRSNDPYQIFCRDNGLKGHPARMPTKLADFFINFLTSKDDLVLDPFGGSNTTGLSAHNLGRRWLAIEAKPEYAYSSLARFSPLKARRVLLKKKLIKNANPPKASKVASSRSRKMG